MQLFYKGVITLYSDTITDKFYPQDYRKSVKASKNLVSNTVIQFTIHYHQFFPVTKKKLRIHLGRFPIELNTEIRYLIINGCHNFMG